MPNATINTITISGSLTTSMVANGIRDALISIGYTLFDSYLASNVEQRIYTLTRSNATKGTIFLQVSVFTNGTLNYQIHESWNSTTKVGTNTNTVTSNYTISLSTVAIQLYIVDHPEFKGLILEQGTTQIVIGILRPKNIVPSWWSENSFPYAFITKYSVSPANSRFGATTTPFGNNLDYEFLQSTKLQDGNAQNNNARSILPLCILSFGVGGILLSCDDLIVCASNTARPLDTILVSPTEIYTYIWGNALHSGIAIRTT